MFCWDVASTVITTGCSGPGRDTRPEWVIDRIPSSVSCTFLSFLNYHQCIVKSSTNSCSSVYLPATCSSGLYSRRLAQDLILRQWWITYAVWPSCLCLSDYCICDQAPMRPFSLSEISRLMLISKHDLRSTYSVCQRREYPHFMMIYARANKHNADCLLQANPVRLNLVFTA